MVVAQTNLLGAKYNAGGDSGARARSAFVDRALDRLQTAPGVQSAAITSSMPFTGESNVHSILRQENPLPENKAPVTNLRNISPDYFPALHIPLIAGSSFSAQEKNRAVHAVISESAARATWPGQNALGQPFRMNGGLYTVSGIAADARDRSKTRDTCGVPSVLARPAFDDLFHGPQQAEHCISSQCRPARTVGHRSTNRTARSSVARLANRRFGPSRVFSDNTSV